MNLDKEMYDTVCRRIKEVEMEAKTDPRITVHASADVESIRTPMEAHLCRAGRQRPDGSIVTWLLRRRARRDVCDSMH